MHITDLPSVLLQADEEPLDPEEQAEAEAKEKLLKEEEAAMARVAGILADLASNASTPRCERGCSKRGGSLPTWRPMHPHQGAGKGEGASTGGEGVVHIPANLVFDVSTPR